MSEEKSVEALRAELELHKAELKKLEDQVNPPPSEPFVMPRFDPTEGMSMPRNAMQAMIDAVPESLMKELRADARKPNPVTQASSIPCHIHAFGAISTSTQVAAGSNLDHWKVHPA